MKIAVVIPVTGAAIWDERADNAARTAYDGQIVRPDEIIIHRSDTVSNARNEGAEKASSDHLIFLDADDELDPDYIQSMKHRALRASLSYALYRPNTIGFYEDGSEDNAPCMIPKRDIYTGNYIVIGAMCNRSSFLKLGGFNPYPILEDWDLWLRMVHQGCRVVDVPEAIYRIGVHPGSRNTSKDHGKIYARIRRNITKQ